MFARLVRANPHADCRRRPRDRRIAASGPQPGGRGRANKPETNSTRSTDSFCHGLVHKVEEQIVRTSVKNAIVGSRALM